ncbi:MAG: tripartite tricarboxylate transporter substrate binding protein [Proteobacteria bacterium]|nr:tripartite tricarboxylate transporter substrate binding protein [Pseudomonadota bacterium]
MTRFSVRLAIATAGFVAGTLAAVTALSPAAAVEIPCNTARVIVPWAAGGESDIISRLFTEAANRLGAKPQLQVVNISGQGGNKGAKEALGAKPDGCTVFNAHQSVLSALLTGRVDFTWSDYAVAGNLTVTPSIIGAHPSVPFANFKELQAYAKANPEKVLAGASLGSTSHFNLVRLQNALGVKFKYISYDGTRERMTALLANNIQIGQISDTAAAQYLKSGELKVLGILFNKRSKLAPDVRTGAEQGVDLVIGTNRGFLLPKATPKPAVEYYTQLVKKVAEDPQFVKQMEDMGSFVVYMGGKDYEKWWAKEFEDWKEDAIAVGLYKPIEKGKS